MFSHYSVIEISVNFKLISRTRGKERIFLDFQVIYDIYFRKMKVTYNIYKTKQFDFWFTS